jgi:predicted metal-dependent phosphoesterase TrpH
MSIDDLIFYAKRAGLDFVSITDHDTMDGVARASILGKRHGISVIAGVEISCYDYNRSRKVHVLCYLPDKPDRLQGVFSQILESRTKAGKKAIRAVTRYYPVTEEHIARYSSGGKSIYRIHIMQALLDLGYDNVIYGALYNALFDRDHGLCFYEPEYPDVYDVLPVIHSAGGVAVLAHPLVYDSLPLLHELGQKGLIHGVETSHPSADDEITEKILAPIALEYGLLQTGGSDFHGYFNNKAYPIASRVTSDEQINALFKLKSTLASV